MKKIFKRITAFLSVFALSLVMLNFFPEGYFPELYLNTYADNSRQCIQYFGQNIELFVNENQYNYKNIDYWYRDRFNTSGVQLTWGDVKNWDFVLSGCKYINDSINAGAKNFEIYAILGLIDADGSEKWIDSSNFSSYNMSEINGENLYWNVGATWTNVMLITAISNFSDETRVCGFGYHISYVGDSSGLKNGDIITLNSNKNEEYTLVLDSYYSPLNMYHYDSYSFYARLYKNGIEINDYYNYNFEWAVSDSSKLRYELGVDPRFVTLYASDVGTSIVTCTCMLNSSVIASNSLTVNILSSINKFQNVPLSFNSEIVDEKVGQINFKYSDSLFNSNANNYNFELSKLSSIMAASAYWDSNKDYRYVKNNLDKLGFANITDCGSYAKLKNMTENNCDYVSYTFATKDIYINNQKNTIVAVIIKGTSGNEEWFSNFNVGETNYNTGDRHAGFETANRRLMDDLSNYLSDKDLIPSKTKFWITGHSRGAGVGNLLAADITDGKLEVKGSCPIFYQNNIYAYLYAPPAGVVMNYCDYSHNNIYNFINPQDFVPRMPLQKWNYSRYGKDYVYPNEVTSKYVYNYTTGTYRFESSEYQKRLINTFYALFNEPLEKYLMKNGTASTIKICNDLYSIAPSVNSYYYGTGFPYINEYAPFNYFHYGLATAAMGGFGNVAAGVKTMLGYAGVSKWDNLNQYFIAGSNINNTVTYSHTPETYIAWAYVCDSVNDFDYNLFVKGIYACPVDIEVYDSHNNLVGRVVNNKVDESVTILSILVDEETSTKTVFMPANEQFTVKALGYDNGTMDYSIELCDITDLSTSDLRSVEDIEITPNTTVTTNTDLSGNVTIVAVTDNGDIVKTVEYTIDKNNIVTTKATTTDNNTPSFPNDSDNNHYTPSNPPSGGGSNVIPPASSSDIESFNVKVENKVTGETKDIIAVRNGENVTVDIGNENNGYYANICTNNGDFIVAVRIEKGEVKFFIPKDVKFSIIIDGYSYGEDVSSGAGATDSGLPIDVASPVTNGVRIPQAEFPRGFRISNKKRKYRILRKRRLDDLVFVF